MSECKLMLAPPREAESMGAGVLGAERRAALALHLHLLHVAHLGALLAARAHSVVLADAPAAACPAAGAPSASADDHGCRCCRHRNRRTLSGRACARRCCRRRSLYTLSARGRARRCRCRRSPCNGSAAGHAHSLPFGAPGCGAAPGRSQSADRPCCEAAAVSQPPSHQAQRGFACRPLPSRPLQASAAGAAALRAAAQQAVPAPDVGTSAARAATAATAVREMVNRAGSETAERGVLGCERDGLGSETEGAATDAGFVTSAAATCGSLLAASVPGIP
eukprot:6179835-Pleurochrysis_carterae.AAC.6